MKKVLIVFASFIALILIAAIAAPIIFKDDIKAAIDDAMAESLNAKVYYDEDGLSLSLFKNFPDLTLTLEKFGIAGVDEFEKDTLLDVAAFSLTVDIMSAINGEQIQIVNVLLDEPNIKVIVLEDGKANYDIAKDTGEVEEEEEEPADSSALSIQIQGWEIRNANVIYDDRSTPMLAVINGLNHQGSGDFTQDVFDMTTTTRVDDFSFGYDGVMYISNKILRADVIMAMDLANMNFTFKENEFALNNFAFGIDGWINMPAEDIDMEINFGGRDIDMKSVLSLVPGDYESYLEGVDAAGKIGFGGYVKGTFNDKSMPQVRTSFSIDQGRVAYADYPIPIEKINVNAVFDYPSADLRETSFVVDKFGMEVDGQPFAATLVFKDLEDYFWDLKVDGTIDLEKITKVVPMEGMSLTGIITAGLQSSGRMSALEAEEYSKLHTAGQMTLAGFNYVSDDLPQGFSIEKTELNFDPKEINLTSFKGKAGKTDLNMSGKITNYMEYALQDDGELLGSLDFYSAGVYVDEWMPEETEEEEEPVDTAALEVIRVPENITFVLASKIDHIYYENLDLKNFFGKVIIEDGAIKLDETGFNILEGSFVMSGAYLSAERFENPLFNADFKINNLSIPSSFKAFNTVKKLAPFAEKMEGKLNSSLTMNGVLGSDMMPIYDALQGKGVLSVLDGKLQEVKLLQAVSKVSKLNTSDGSLEVNDTDVQLSIRDGRVFVKPFDLVMGGRETTFSGSSGLDGTLDYEMFTVVPSGQVGSTINNTLTSFTGGKELVSSTVDVTFGIGGTYDDLQVKLMSAKPTGAEGEGGAKAQAKEQVTQKVDQTKTEVKQKTEAVVDEKKEEVKQEVKEETQQVQEKLEEKTDDAKQDAKKKLKKMF
ncbi:AsmA-like C-terminal region-containing protein [Marinoscillum sp. MHG1-6]|uniref:AsmA family protein n=1 Tax=Marinoscillum sp. MHG1-6 TaxID=2959627 RepID=UPI0021583E7B|nr:AsmA-like C-terminal region-containing protein [Marinoscillum sp. MHG1-6]